MALNLDSLKNAFTGNAGDPDSGKDDTVFAASTHPEGAPPIAALTSEEERAEKLRETIDANNEAMKKQKDADKGPPGKPAGIAEDPHGYDLRPTTLWGKFQDVWKLGIMDRGSYMKFKPDQRNMAEQIRAVILRQVFDKGNTNIYFYRQNQLDIGTAQQAQVILGKMIAQGVIPQSYNVQIMMDRMDHAEPWLTPIGKWTRDWRNDYYDKKLKWAAKRDYGSADNLWELVRGGGRGVRELKKRFGTEAAQQIMEEARPKEQPAPAPGAGGTPPPGSAAGADKAKPATGPTASV